MADKTKLDRRAKQNGRVSPRATSGKAGSRRPSRYTQPIPRAKRRSPAWYPWVLLSLLGLGVLVIILNYVQVMPGSPTNWYTLGGLIGILIAAVAATYYH